MGPRPISRGENPARLSRINPQELQWGRGRSAAERSGSAPFNSPATSSFNGAAADQPRRGGENDEHLKSEVCFNGAAADQPRRAE